MLTRIFKSGYIDIVPSAKTKFNVESHTIGTFFCDKPRSIVIEKFVNSCTYTFYYGKSYFWFLQNTLWWPCGEKSIHSESKCDDDEDYSSIGPNHVWHVDGCVKQSTTWSIKPYTFKRLNKYSALFTDTINWNLTDLQCMAALTGKYTFSHFDIR